MMYTLFFFLLYIMKIPNTKDMLLLFAVDSNPILKEIFGSTHINILELQSRPIWKTFGVILTSVMKALELK